ncbi:MAG: alpha-glucosidase [Clostridia bacterium]|nr:alpha-glucosidase [Clostridia bacterium]
MQGKEKKWWQESVIYQIYPRSFYDSNADGIGDLQGIVTKLDYLEKLGIDAIWLSPVYKSPQDDNGYDISDYRDIDPIFGNLSDMDELIKEAKKRNIKIIMDLVLNHSSDEHPWFMEAKKSKDNPYHDYYVWRDGEKGVYPNDLKSAFCGPAWEWVEECQQYYLHQFSVKQPDLNWENPKLRQAVYDMINWWIDRGVGGFRLDVIDLIGKETDKMVMAEGEMLHPYLKEMSKATFQRAELVTVGEAWSATPERAKLYSNPNGSELSMVFQFEHILLDQQEGKEKWDLADLPFVEFKKVFTKWQKELNGTGWNSLFLGNHDLPRSVSRFGDDGKYRNVSAKMLATVIHGMQGTPYIYQGEELGMTNVKFDISDYRDIELINMYNERLSRGYDEKDIMKSIYAKGRDNARTPMQWDDSENAGFTKGTPWLRLNPNYAVINAQEALENSDSIFYYYQKLIALRKQEEVFIDGVYAPVLEEDENIFAYTRKNENAKMLVLCNFKDTEVSYELEENWDDGQVLIANYPDQGEKGKLRPYEAKIVIIKSR